MTLKDERNVENAPVKFHFKVTGFSRAPRGFFGTGDVAIRVLLISDVSRTRASNLCPLDESFARKRISTNKDEYSHRRNSTRLNRRREKERERERERERKREKEREKEKEGEETLAAGARPARQMVQSWTDATRHRGKVAGLTTEPECPDGNRETKLRLRRQT